MKVTHDLVSMTCVFARTELFEPDSRLTATVRWFAADPFAVHVSWLDPHPVRKVWSRDLLAEGCLRPAGEHDTDMHVWPGPGHKTVVINLSSPAGWMRLSIPLEVLGRFLAKSYEIVPAGTEYSDTDVDGLLHNWLGEAA